ncbi:uncharacterized protein N7515_000387 [Penicillium bovifimosum]|uniref:Uncharacterized protein n=1 Tax=Penicillium bovifimosum TaxID=126998 RepID=A0A9W9LBI6_9EURO|nr:uncharacterized protein N7515_000387 [Penicillium bovifimosum]KAJ5145823.1 hypothetical protein N7515_000387 [Penicillium bovifimosum]
MEVAPLVLAHTHARNAVLETRKANPVAASEEHDLAAGEFATAAQGSSDLEALRTLRLLETHHKKLAEILRFQHEHPATPSTEAASAAPSSLATQQTAADGNTKAAAATPDAHNLPPRLAGNARIPGRDKSSIASNLASARGIPSHPRRGSPVSPTLTSQHAAAKMTETPSRARGSESRLRDGPNKNRASRVSTARPPWSPPIPSSTEMTTQQTAPSIAESGAPKEKPAITDEAFDRFYSAFGSLVSKVSGPLAFAGIQMGQTGSTRAEPSRKAPAEVKVNRGHATLDQSITGEPDVDKLFSRAALRSIRDGSGAGPGNPAESFYVVPTTGGTMSYAGILTRAERQARRNSVDDGEDDFVDARENTPIPRNAPQRHPQKQKTMEELQVENETLRGLTDSLATRLHMWEVSAQSSSMALQQSIRMMHRQTGGTPDHFQSGTTSPVATMSAPPGAAETDARIKELEERIRNSEKKLETASHENEKLKNVLGRYRDRWEKLKEGAKTRRAEVRSGDAQSSQSPSVGKQEAPGSPGPGQSSALGQPGSGVVSGNTT